MSLLGSGDFPSSNELLSNHVETSINLFMQRTQVSTMQSKRAFTIQWHITDRCNLECTHCYRDKKTQELPLSQLKKVADNLIEGISILDVAPCFALSGGEPLLREDFYDLVDYLYLKGIPYVLIETNGTLIDSQIAKIKEHSPPIAAVQVSLDGSTPSVNDAIRGEGAYERALSGLNCILKDTSLQTTISYTFHAQNVGDIPSLVELGERLGVDTLYLTRLVPIGHGKEMNAILTPEQTRYVLTYLHTKNEEFKTFRKNGVKKPVIAENRGLFHLTDPGEAARRYNNGGDRLGNACAVGSSTFTILSDGTALPCRRLPIPIGNLLETPFLEIWFKNDLLWEFRRRQKNLKGKCVKCPFLKYRGLCDGGASCIAYGCCGDYNQPDPQCWYLPEAP